VILTLSIIIILNQSFLNLDFVPRNTAWGWYIKVIIHEPNFGLWPYVGSYPIIPWIGVMGLGWGFGKYLSTLKLENIRKLKTPLTLTGIGSIIIFFLVRWTNGYGNLLRRTGSSVIDWLYVSKYPPSIAFLLWTLGWMCIFISLGLALQNYSWYENGITGAILTFGRNPLFFYITHLWIYRMRLPSIIRPEPPRLIYLELWQSVILWLAGLVLLWQLCLSYEKLKKAYPKYLQYV
jgi:uncharacterized membrane protein